MSQHEVRQVEDRTTNLPSRRAFLRRGLALGAGLLVNGSASAVAAGVGVDLQCHRVRDGGL
jgi:anti-sigma factor RsiW